MKKDIALRVAIVSLMFLFCSTYATVWYVHPDSTLSSIQIALDSCSTGDTVLVAPGVYYENIDWPNTHGIDLISEYGDDMTVIDGGGTGRVIACHTGVDTTTIIDEFTIQNGYADNGGGISCVNSSPTITGNTITGNTSTYSGGGIRCLDNSSPIIDDNTITLNHAYLGGGGIVVTNSSPTITENTITVNTADILGGGIACFYYSSPTITNNTITDNESFYGGGGIGCYSYPSPTITGNIITGNTADYAGGGIGFRLLSSPTITHNTIEENTALFGGGIGCDSSSSGTIDSCTISGNNYDGVYCAYASSPEIHYNNIIDNIGYGVRNVSSGVSVNAEYNWWGDSTGPYHPLTNPDGLGDTVSNAVDYIPWLLEAGIEEKEILTQFSLFQNYPNPFVFRTTIAYQLPFDTRITLKVYNPAGQLVKTLVDERKEAGYHMVSWDGHDNRGRQAAAGIYFYSLATEKYTETRKMILMR